MKFEFAFEKLLGHRKATEDDARKNWGEAQARLNDALKQLESMYGQIDETRKRVHELGASGHGTGPVLAQLDEFINGQRLRIDMHRSNVREIMTEVERLHEILIEAAKERKTLEKLRERRFEEYKQMRKKREMKQMDDMVVMRHAAKIMAEKEQE